MSAPRSRGARLAVALILPAAGALAAPCVLPPSVMAAPSWRACGTYRQAAFNGYVTTNQVQARGAVTCAVARHIALHFMSGGYNYDGLTCFYASMGTSYGHWDWSCSPGLSGRNTSTEQLVRGHSQTTAVGARAAEGPSRDHVRVGAPAPDAVHDRDSAALVAAACRRAAPSLRRSAPALTLSRRLGFGSSPRRRAKE